MLAVSNMETSTNPQIFSPAYYDRLFEIEDRHWWSLGMREIEGALLEAYLPHSALDILDSGCGTGAMLTWLEKFSRGRQVVGIDLAPEAVAYCGRRGHTRVELGSVIELPFADASFDLVHSGDVLQHLPSDSGPHRALNEAWRVLRTGGHLFIRTNARPRRSKTCANNYQHFDQARVTELVRGAGFEVLSASYANCLPSLYEQARTMLARRTNASRHSDHGLLVRLYPAHLSWLNTLMLFQLKGEAWVVSKLGVRLPYGHTVVCLARKPAVAKA